MAGQLTKGHEFEALSYKTNGACIDVQRQLGLHGMEGDYQRALELALPKKGLEFAREVEVGIVYEGVIVSKRRVDFVVTDGTRELVLETKARSALLAEDVEQCLLYLHHGGFRLCLLVNFGQKPLGIKRLVHSPR
jgi:GxxExxY protein